MRHSLRDKKTGRFISERGGIRIMCGTEAAKKFEEIFKEYLKDVDMKGKKGYRLYYR